jgi:hypothetical protein
VAGRVEARTASRRGGACATGAEWGGARAAGGTELVRWRGRAELTQPHGGVDLNLLLCAFCRFVLVECEIQCGDVVSCLVEVVVGHSGIQVGGEGRNT